MRWTMHAPTKPKPEAWSQSREKDQKGREDVGGQGAYPSTCYSLSIEFFFSIQKPELVAIEASIAHSTRKLNNAQKLREQVDKEVDKQATKVRSYQVDLETVQRAANEAQGK
jgi:hypothetical protein